MPRLLLLLTVLVASLASSKLLSGQESFTDQQISRLIEQLGSDEFAVREMATLRLIEAGSVADKALKKAADTASIEVQIRLKEILSSRPVETESDLNESDQTLVEQFLASNSRGQLLMLRTHATSNKPRLFLKLIEIDLRLSAESNGERKPAIESYLATNGAAFSNLLTSAIARSNWSAVKDIVEHPITRSYSPMIRAFAAKGKGKLQEYIDETFETLKQQRANGQIEENNLSSLIGLLRLSNDFARANTAISWLADKVTQQQIRRAIIFQQGDWGELLRRSNLDIRDELRITTNDTQKALLQYLARDEAGLIQTISAMRERLKTASKQSDNETPAADATAKKLRGSLRLIGILTLNWELTQEFLDPADNLENAQLMAAINRTDRALEFLNASGDFDQRLKRMTEVLSQLRATQEALMKRSTNRRDAKYTELKTKEKSLSTTAQLIAEAIENRGLDDEAYLYYQMIFAGDKSNARAEQQYALQKMLEIGRTDNYWQLAESIIRGPDKQKFASRVVYGVSSVTAQSIARQWLAVIRGSFSDPVVEAKTIASMVNSPWSNSEELDFDLDYEIARYRTRAGIRADGVVEYYLGRVYELHGDDDSAAKLLQQSAELGNTLASELRFQQAVANGDSKTILDSWLQGYSGFRSASRGLIAEDAARRLLDQGGLSETERKELERHVQQAEVATMSIWHGNSHWLNSGINELSTLESLHLAAFPLKAIVYGVNGDPRASQQMRIALAESLASKKSDQKKMAAPIWSGILFESLAFNSANAKSNQAWMRDALALHFAWAKGLIEQGKYQQATDLLVRVSKFSLGDVTAGEEAIGLLESAGRMEDADRLYRSIADHYLTALLEYPDSPLARNNLAWLNACAKRNLDSAYRHAQMAVARRPNTVQYLDTLAEIEFLRGDTKEAFELSKRCVQLYPTRTYYRQQKRRFFDAMNR